MDDAEILRVFERQEKNYGGVLENHAVLARRPAIFRGFRAMWDGLEESGLLGTRLACLLNLRRGGTDRVRPLTAGELCRAQSRRDHGRGVDCDAGVAVCFIQRTRERGAGLCRRDRDVERSRRGDI